MTDKEKVMAAGFIWGTICGIGMAFAVLYFIGAL